MNQYAVPVISPTTLPHLIKYTSLEGPVEREIQVTNMGRSIEGTRQLDKVSYRVAISEGGKNVVVEARIPTGTLKTLWLC